MSDHKCEICGKPAGSSGAEMNPWIGDYTVVVKGKKRLFTLYADALPADSYLCDECKGIMQQEIQTLLQQRL